MMPARALIAFVFTITVLVEMSLFQTNETTNKFPQQTTSSFDTTYFCTFARIMLS